MGLFDKFKNKNSNIAKAIKEVVAIYNIEFPFYVDVYDIDCDEEKSTELYGEKAFNYLSAEDMNGICLYFENSELYKYFNDISRKIINIKMNFLSDGHIRLSTSVNESFSETEKQKLLDLITGQMSDGWGEGDFDFEKNTGETYSISFWKNKNWNIKYID
jgi:hypothetical protein